MWKYKTCWANWNVVFCGWENWLKDGNNENKYGKWCLNGNYYYRNKLEWNIWIEKL
jgi:hypothetical protein